VARDPRIALASGAAFLAGQLVDIAVFDRLRRRSAWWLPPLASSLASSALDTALFFSLAFAGQDLHGSAGAGRLRREVRHGGAMLLPYAGLRSSLPAWGGRGTGWGRASAQEESGRIAATPARITRSPVREPDIGLQVDNIAP
jgi:hypothetical protein